MTDAFQPLAYSIRSAVKATDSNRSRIYDLIAAGALDARKLGRQTVITGDSLRAYMAGLPKAPIRANHKQAA